ncbi:hypothetical protein BT96DRAFT_952258, partial [Gymnopus androsaceus JB14]
NFTNLALTTTIADEDLLQFFQCQSSIVDSNLPLPSSWMFTIGERVTISDRFAHYRAFRTDAELKLQLMLKDRGQGYIRDVEGTRCTVEFSDRDNEEGSQVSFALHHLLKVMHQGDHVRVGHGSRKASQLGVTEGSSATQRIPLDGKIGLVVTVSESGENLEVQFNDYPFPQEFHANTLFNLTLMLSPNDVVKRGVKKPLSLTDPVYSVVPKHLVSVEPSVSIRTAIATPEPLNPAVHTGHRPWIGKEVRIVGLDDGGATVKHHKAENGSVLDVNRDDSKPSGLAIAVRLYTGIIIHVDYGRVRRFVDGKFLHDNGSHNPPTYDPHFHFKVGYEPQYTQTELARG